MSCLDNWIGVVGLSEYSTSRSGYYINDLPGMTLAQLNMIKDTVEDYEDPANAWEAILLRTKNNFKADIKGHARKYYRSRTIIDDSITGRVEKNTLITSANKLTGLYFDLWTYSRNLELHLNYARMHLSVAAAPTIYVYNAATGDLIESFTSTSGTEVKIDLNYDIPTYQYSKIFVCYDDTGLSVYKTADFDFVGYIHQNRSVADTSTVLEANLAGADIGLSLSYQVRCSIENYICQNIDALTEAFLYKLGVEWMNERIYSDRVNRYTLVDMERAKELKIYYQEEYKEHLDKAIAQINIDDDGVCFECAHDFNKRLVLP